MTIEIDYVGARFSDEDDAVIVTRGGNYTFVYKFIRHGKEVWEFVEAASEHYDVKPGAEPSESDLRAILKKDPHLLTIYASGRDRKLADISFNVKETPYKDHS